VHRVARAVEQVVPSERTYLLSLGSQQAVAHVHWHIAPLPPGTPFEQQQFHALMMENGVIPWSTAQAAELAGRLRAVLARGESARIGTPAQPRLTTARQPPPTDVITPPTTRPA
jgi:histidine triad (HIT) family protein/ATP adenylyltransferase